MRKMFYSKDSRQQQSSQEMSQKSVTVVDGAGKVKGTGQSNKKRIPSANLDLPRAFLACKVNIVAES